MKGSAKIEFSNAVLCNCFVIVTWPLRSTTANLKILGVESQLGRKHYFSISNSTLSASNKETHVIKINGKYGESLNLKDGELVRFWVMGDETDSKGRTITSAKVSCLSKNDWEILETNAEFVANHLLDQLRVVYPGQEFPFWLSKSITIRLRIDDVKPSISEYGILTSSSEIIVPSLSTPDSISSLATLKTHVKLRSHILQIPESLSLIPSEVLLFSNQHHAFIYKSHLQLPEDFPVSQISMFARIKLFEEPGENDIQNWGNELFLIRLFFVEQILENNPALEEYIPYTNTPCIFISPDYAARLKISIKSWIWCSFLDSNDISDLPYRQSISYRCIESQSRSLQSRAFETILLDCINFIKASLSLSQQPTANHSLIGAEFGSLIIQGGSGSGKTTLANNIAQVLSKSPYFMHCEFICCAKLRGKKPENMAKEISKRLEELENKHPAILVLDDFDIITNIPKTTGEQSYQEELLQYKTCETLLQTLLKNRSRYNKLAVLFTVNGKESMNSYWMPRSGFHFFQKWVKIPVPTKSERLQIFMTCLNRYLENSGCDDLSHGTKTFDNSPKSESRSGASVERRENVEPQNDANVATYEDELTKRICLCLGSIHEQNATPMFLVTVAKKWGAYLQSLDISSLGNDHVSRENVAEGRGHVPSSTALQINELKSNEDVNKQMKVFNEILQEEIRFSGDFHQIKKDNQRSKITLNSIGGLQGIKQELKKILEWPIKFPQFFKNAPVKLPCGILFYGYPGTGKSLMGIAAQTMANVKFIHVKGPELLSKYIGASEQAVQEVFTRARESRPCILFFDEFDSLVPRRGHDSSGVTDRVVNQFLTEMDGIDGGLGEGVYLLAATSRPDLIDPAVLRPGRLDKHFFFDLPTKGERKEILKAIAASQEDASTNLELEDESDWEKISQLTEGFTGADLNALMFSAHLSVVHEYLGQNCSYSSEASAQKTSPQNEIKVGVKSIMSALNSFKPSLHGYELKKFQAIYQEFSQKEATKLGNDTSSQGSRMIPGKRATLA